MADDLADTPDDKRRPCKVEKSAKKALEAKRNHGPDLRVSNRIIITLFIRLPPLTVLSGSFRSPFSFGRPP